MEQFLTIKRYPYFLIGILVFLGLYLTSLYNYLLFHSLVEIFSIVVACGIFIVAWNSRRFLDNNYLLFIGIAYLFVGGLDLIHTLAYKGMGVFQGYETNLATQLWIATRYVQSLSLFIAPFFFPRKLKINLVFLGYTVVVSLLLMSIFYWNIFPVCFIEGVGLTSFKKISEYIISLILLASIFLLLKNRREFEREVLQWVVWSIIVTIVFELAFTFYIDAYGFSNLIGHFFEILAFYFIYKAIIETGLRRPYDLLFRDLKQKEQALAQLASFPELNPNPVVEVDLTGHVSYLNSAAKHLFPDLQTTGLQHRWLTDLEALADIFERQRKSSHLRELKIGEVWYEQTIHYVFESKRLRIYGLDVTERKRAEERIKESEKKYRELYEGSQDGFVHVDMEGHIKEFNRAYIEMLGYSKDELMKLTYVDLTPKKWHSMEAKIVEEQVLTKGYSKVYEKEYIKKDGTIFPVSLRTYFIKDKNGNPLGMWAFVRDITKRKEMEEALRRSRDELEIRVQERTLELTKANEELQIEITERKRVEKTLIEQSRILDAFFTSTITPLVFLDRNFNFVRVNEAYAKACQRDISEFDGHNHFEFYPHEENEAIFRKVVETKFPYQAIARPFAFPDHPEWGITYWDLTLTPLLDNNGEVGFLIFSLEDVTERVRAEKARARFAHIVEATSDLVGMANLDGQLLYLNKAGRKMLGLGEDEGILGVRISDTHPDWANAMVLNEGIPTALQTGLWNAETAFLSRDGTEISVSQVILAHKGPNGKVEFLSSIARDITERKRAEEAVEAERQRFNDVLEILPAYLVLLTPDYHVPFTNRFFRERFGESHGRRCFEYLFGRSEPCEICETYSVLKTMAPHEWEWTGPDGRNYHVFDFPFTDTDGSTLILEMGIDITEGKEIQRRIEATNAILDLFVKKSIRKEYLDSIIGLIQTWSGCRCVGIRVLNKQGLIPYESYMGFSKEFWESENRLSIRRDQCACIRVITGNPDPQDVSMMTTGGSFHCGNTFKFVGQLSEEEKARFRGICVQNGFLSVSIVPIRYRDEVIGAIHLADEREGQVPLKAMEFIESVAPLIGEAIHRFNLEEELRESENRLRHLSSQLLTVQENERKRITREIHDGIGQMLTAIKFKVESTIQETGKGRGRPKKKPMEAIIPMIQESIEEVRRIQMDLRPSTLDDLGILATLEWFCREYQKIYSHIRIEKEIGLQESEVSTPLKTVIYRVMQEAMNNIAKHSKADLLHLSLKKKDDRIELVVEDNGTGFDLEKSKKGFGLGSMRERTELSGGTFTIESTKGKGTMIRIIWPIS